jgi:molybdopterin synthase sulfur carrier subunit
VPAVVLAPSLARWLTAAPGESVGERRLAVPGTTVRELLAALFERHPALRGYVVDDVGAVRHHVVLYLNDTAIEKTQLDAPIDDHAELFLFQALSGG